MARAVELEAGPFICDWMSHVSFLYCVQPAGLRTQKAEAPQLDVRLPQEHALRGVFFRVGALFLFVRGSDIANCPIRGRKKIHNK